ncbi:hypothetical protein M951_chr3183 (nucleomorph) [Lotharella oceanica]|uniref:Uncharacterized protein n=1 Tax=Lotharella oceanica TaxID=641309 RepID=A0A060DC61_9EUKA|nr:hypothetical protein M951_chr122 [Lotharella oceanica]AIB09688.1 hypothetical protein M951_chr1209 [Lotharella oceanica]AIB09725.1 hypothetical protein M951_chr222 [Lotharella oceanica]AIB09891.1 hypothetical protein M951_chr2199 [Lotharella oceanica]AIB09928.1 hypothetical protein M951_chr322 [Lotharella oceanica]
MRKVLMNSKARRRNMQTENVMRVGKSIQNEDKPYFRYAYSATKNPDQYNRERKASKPTPLNNPRFPTGHYFVCKKKRDVNKYQKSQKQSSNREIDKNVDHKRMLDSWKRVKVHHMNANNSRPRGELASIPKGIPRITEAEVMTDRYVIRPALKKDRTLRG